MQETCFNPANGTHGMAYIQCFRCKNTKACRTQEFHQKHGKEDDK